MTPAARSLLACCLWMIACSRPPDAKPAQGRVSSPKLASADTLAPLPDSILKRIAALEDSLARDSLGRRAPMWLWTLGTLTQTSLSDIPGTGHYGEYARAHAVQYSYSGPDAAFVYNGYHFAEIAQRFPHDTLADDAGYALTKLGIVGECEGYVPCYISRDLFPLREFLERFPDSPLAQDAVRRANAAFDSTFAAAPAPTDSLVAWEVDSAAIRAEIAGYDSTAMVLPPPLRALALPTIERLRSRWGRPRHDSLDVEPGGAQVDFRSARCGLAFRHPESWEVVERERKSRPPACTFELRPRDRRIRLVRDHDVDLYSISVDLSENGFEQGLRESGFKRDDGRWVVLGREGMQLPARMRAGAAWHGLTAVAQMGCYREDGAYFGLCEEPTAFIGTAKRSAHIVGGPQSTAVFDLMVRTIVLR